MRIVVTLINVKFIDCAIHYLCCTIFNRRYAYDPFGIRLSKERQDKLAWTSTDPKRTHFVWDGTRLLQEYTYKGSYTYIYTDQDSYEPLAQIFDNAKDGKQYLAYFHNDQIGIPREMTDIHGNLLWYGEYTA